MSQSLSAVYVHLVFSTKERRPFLKDPMTRRAVHAVIGGISRTLGCPALEVGGVADHVHVLARLGRNLPQSDWVKELKRVSNRWLGEQPGDHAGFAWQSGYATFSVSASGIDQVAAYIRNQEAHHRNAAFQDELRTLLTRYRMEWDERFIWL